VISYDNVTSFLFGENVWQTLAKHTPQVRQSICSLYVLLWWVLISFKLKENPRNKRFIDVDITEHSVTVPLLVILEIENEQCFQQPLTGTAE
jgi:hypothetical protein